MRMKLALTLAISVLMAGLTAAEPEVIWPEEWTGFGPAPASENMRGGGTPLLSDLLPGEQLKNIPEVLNIGDLKLTGRRVRADVEGRIDLTREFGGGRGATVYLMASVKALKDTTIQVGAGADWWMHWWLDGQPIFNTLAGGNKGAVSANSHVFNISLSKGEHVLAVAVIAGSSSFVFMTASPEEMRKPEIKAVSGVRWPEEWMLYGLVPGPYYGSPVTSVHLLPGEVLKAIPEELVVNNQKFAGRKMKLGDDALSLAKEFPSVRRLGSAYLMAPVSVERDCRVKIGAGANWWMKWWLDGQQVFDTLERGNGGTPATARDHVFELDLMKGEHVLAVAVIAGTDGGFSFAVSGPDEMAARPQTFKEVIEIGNKKLHPPHWSTAVDYQAAAIDFRHALDLAENDGQRVAARMALANALLLDGGTTNFAAVRQEYEQARSLSGRDAYQRARIALGIGETWLRDGRGDLAREEFNAAIKCCPSEMAWLCHGRLGLARADMLDRNDAAALKELRELQAVMHEVDAKSGDRKFSLDVCVYLAALELVPQIRDDRPRLFFNADTWPAVKERILAGSNDVERLQQELVGLPDQPEVRDYGASLMNAALLYRATGDVALLRKIRRLLRATVDSYRKRVSFNAQYESRLGFVAALDWLWNDLPPDECESLARDFTDYLYALRTDLRFRNHIGAAYYYEPAILWHAGLTLFRSDLEPVERMRVLTILGHGYFNHMQASYLRHIDVMKDRGYSSSIEYAMATTPQPFWTFLHCWRSAIGSIPDEWSFAGGFAPSFVLRYVFEFKKGEMRHFGYSRSWRKRGGWTEGGFTYNNLEQFACFFGQAYPEEVQIAGWLRARMKEAGGVRYDVFPVFRYLLDSGDETKAKPELPEGLPLARLFGVNGLMLMSSGFDPSNSTYALYSSGCVDGRGNSEHFDAGHFTIFKKGCLALDSGTRALGNSQPGISGRNYDDQSVAHNTILIRMPDEKIAESNSGGQRRKPADAKVIAFESDHRFAYAATDATDTYHTNKCAQMVRQFVYLPPDHFVVFDRVIAKNAEYPKTWLLHTGNEPMISGNEFQADQEEGRIFCRTLLPAGAVLEKIGGPGKEFWADGRNWPIPDSSPYFRTVNISNASDIAENMGRWRVEIKPGTARTEDVFLHLIQASDQTVKQMVASELHDDAEQAGVTFTAGARTYAIKFNKTGVVGGKIHITENSKVLIDRPLTDKIMPQVGLALVK